MKIKTWFLATRPWSFVMTIVSCLLGAIFALKELNVTIFLLILVGLILAHAATNLLNDYFDVKTRVDKPNAPTAQYRPHPYLSGLIMSSSLLLTIIIIYALTIAIAFYLYFLTTNLAIFFFLIFGLLISIFYTFPYFSLKYRALGEPFVAIIWGPFMVFGTYYVLTFKMNIIVLLASIPIGILVALVLMANNIRDMDYDKSAGIKTIPIILGKERSLNLFKILLGVCYLVVGIVAYLDIPFSLISLVTILQAIRIVKRFEKEVPPNADPIVANLTLIFGILYIIGTALSLIVF